MNAGYSKTPLIKKLGIKEGFKVKLYHIPDNYFKLLEKSPDEIDIVDNRDKTAVDFIHYFVSDRIQFLNDLEDLQSQIKQTGMIWISWDKTKSKLEGAVNENVIRKRALSLDLVDIKVCAVSKIWSGLKLVIRKEKRKS